MLTAKPKYDSATKTLHQAITEPTLKISLGQFILDKLDEFDPNKIIEINYDNDKELGAAELKKLMLNCAKNFTNLGIKKNDRIALFTTMTSCTTPVVYGSYIIGAAVTPMDTLLNDDFNEIIFKQLDPNVIIYDEEFKDRVFKIIKKINFTNLKLTLSADSETESTSVPNMICRENNSNFEIPIFANPNEVVGAILLTSGTTGPAKQMVLSHALLALYVDNWWPGTKPSKTYIASPFRWISQFLGMLQPIFNQTTRIFTRKHHCAEICFEVIEKYGVTHLFGVAKILINLLNYAKQKGQYLQSIQYVMTAGERIPKSLEEIIQKYISHAQFIRAYGTTELGGATATNFYIKEKSNGYYPVPGVSIKIIDDEDNLVDINCNGRICGKTVVPNLGYWNNAEYNQKSFLNDWIITGDYGKIDSDNKLFVYNRYKDLIFFQNKTIIPSIIEEILDDHPAVDGSTIIGISIDQQSKEAIPVAFIKLKFDSINLVTKDDILEYLRNNLNNELYIKNIFFINEFPLITCGKTDKNKLRNMIKVNVDKKNNLNVELLLDNM